MIVILIVAQLVFAVVVVLVLKKLLDRELVRAALEEFESCKTSTEIKEITVRSSSPISDEFKSYFESIRQHKFIQAKFNFQEDASIKGGVIIAMGDVLLDFSLLSRLQNFWS